MLQSMDGCWHRLFSLDLQFEPAKRQSHTANLQLLGCQVFFRGIFPFLNISLNLSANTSPTFSSLPSPPGITFPPYLHLQAAWLTAAPTAALPSPELVVLALPAALTSLSWHCQLFQHCQLPSPHCPSSVSCPNRHCPSSTS